MFKEFMGQNITIIISTRTDNLLEYSGILESETDENIVLKDANICYMMLNIQKGIFGNNINQYKRNLEKVIVNKSYIISCNKTE